MMQAATTIPSLRADSSEGSEMTLLDTIRWVIAVAGPMALLVPTCIAASERERPAARALRWLTRLFPIWLGAPLLLFIAYRIDGDISAFTFNAVSMIASVPLACVAIAIHLWRSRDALSDQATGATQQPQGGDEQR